jgi:hypothetical protein
MATPLLTATPGAAPTYNPSMAETFSWVPVEGAGRPLFAQATYLANPEDIKISLSAGNINVSLDELELNTDEIEELITNTNVRLDSLTADVLDIENLLKTGGQVDNRLGNIDLYSYNTYSNVQEIRNSLFGGIDQIFTGNQYIGGYTLGTHILTQTRALTGIRANTTFGTTSANPLWTRNAVQVTIAEDAPVNKVATNQLVNSFTVNTVTKIFNIFGVSTANIAQYIQIYDTTNVTPQGTPAGVFYVPANSNFSLDFNRGFPITSGKALIVNSLTPVAYNAGNSDFFITAIYN